MAGAGDPSSVGSRRRDQAQRSGSGQLGRRYAERVDEQGEPIEIVDRLKETLTAIAAENRTRPSVFIDNRELFGDLVDHPRFYEAYVQTLNSLHKRGARATLEALVASKGTL